MVNTDEDALICDLAETYGIYEYRSLPLKTVATFSVGLRDNSRIKMKMSGQTVTISDLLLAAITDRLSYLYWAQTKDGQRNRNKPVSIVEKLTNKENEDTAEVFDSIEEYKKRRLFLLGGKNA